LIDYRKSESTVSGPATSLPCIDIGEFIAHKVGDEVEYKRHGSDIVAFIDRGSQIAVRDISDEAVLAVLQLGSEKWGNELSVMGSDDFKRQAIRLAVANDINIANPELQDQIDQERGRLERERVDLGIYTDAVNTSFAPQ